MPLLDNGRALAAISVCDFSEANLGPHQELLAPTTTPTSPLMRPFAFGWITYLLRRSGTGKFAPKGCFNSFSASTKESGRRIRTVISATRGIS